MSSSLPLSSSSSCASSATKSTLRLRVLQVNNVSLLDNFPRLATVIESYKREADHTLVFVGGNFVAPSLLSSLDRGRGMIHAMNAVGVTHVCLGNHEADIPVNALRNRIAESNFTWLNTNLRELDTATKTAAYEILHVVASSSSSSSSGNDKDNKENKNSRKVALLGLLSDEPELYRPGAFGGAKVDSVLETTQQTLATLQAQHPDLDLILPQTHQSIVHDRTFAQTFGGASRKKMPVVMGGHHHAVLDETMISCAGEKCRIYKAGMNAVNVAIHDFEWNLKDNNHVQHKVHLVDTQCFAPNWAVQQLVSCHWRILQELEGAKLFCITEWQEGGDNNKSRRNAHAADNTNDDHDDDRPMKRQRKSVPFSTRNNQCQPTTGSTTLCTIVRRGVRASVCIMPAGCIRGNKLYNSHHFPAPMDENAMMISDDDHDHDAETDEPHWFTWKDLQTEIPFSTEMTTLLIPGRILEDSIASSRKPAYDEGICDFGGFLQTCDMMDFNDATRRIERIRGQPFDESRDYLTALPIVLLQGMHHCQPLVSWWQSTHSILLPDAAMGRPAKWVVLEFFAAQLWLRMGGCCCSSSSWKDAAADAHCPQNFITPEEMMRRAHQLFGRTPVADIVVANTLAVANDGGAHYHDGRISLDDMLMTQFVATDVMSSSSSSSFSSRAANQQEAVLTRLASSLLELPPSHALVKESVRTLRQERQGMDNNSYHGKWSRQELLASLGQWTARRFWS